MLPSFEMLAGVVGLRPPRSSVTEAEMQLLLEFAKGASRVVEVGVFEGATSLALGRALDASGLLILVDPYFRELRLERWFGFSGTRIVARRHTKALGPKARWMETTSELAASELGESAGATMVFLDARHDYDSVCADLRLWERHVAPGGALAIHDCRPSASRPELRPDEGACLAVSEFLARGPWALLAEKESLAVLGRDHEHERLRG